MNSTPPPDLDPVALEAAEQAFLNYCDIDCSQIGWQSPDERKRLAAAIRAWEAKKWRPERERERERSADELIADDVEGRRDRNLQSMAARPS